MGNTSYSFSERSLRSESLGYKTKSANEIFEQNRKRKIHESMEPSKALLREARDSQTHPFSVPIVLALDVTGSMGHIPHYLVKDGLPNLMAGIIQRGVADPQILFLPIGDHECDKEPLQVSQFESGDAELDMWLTRTFIESGGGGNDGESYHLAYYFAAMHTVTDAWEKRNKKGFLFTIGDEPCLRNLPASAIKEIMGTTPQTGYTTEELLAMAQEKYNVYHLHVMEGSAGRRSIGYWNNLLGQNCIRVDNHYDISKIVAEIVVANTEQTIDVEPQIIMDSVTPTNVTPTNKSEESSTSISDIPIMM